MKRHIIIFSLLMVISCVSQAQWVIQHYNQGYVNNLTAIEVDNEGYGFAMGWGLDENGLILKTENGGNEWIEIPNPLISRIQDYYYDSEGAVYVISGCPATSPAQLAVSYDNGLSWDFTMDLEYDFFSISFINNDTGSIAGDEAVFTTFQGPTIWENVWRLSDHGFEGGTLYGVTYVSDGIGYSCGKYYDSFVVYGIVIKTNDYGYTWDTIYLPNFESEFYSIFFVNADTGYMGGWNTIYKTIDGGYTWTEFFIGDFLQVHSIYFPSDNIGYLVAGESAMGWGELYKTYDGGESWQIELCYGDGLFDVYFNNDTVGYCTGNSETILKTIHGGGAIIYGITSGEQIPTFLNIYPNPFSTSTTIEYELTEPSHVQLTIYNAIGEVIHTAVDRMMSQGKHTFTWTADRLPEGMYYGVLRSEEGVSVVKMIKQ